MSKVEAISYSASLAAAAAGTPQRGSVHSVFAAAVNIVFPTERPLPGRPQGSLLLLSEFVLSLNALDAPGMPNGLRLSVPAGAFPFTALRPGMSVLFGAQRLHIEAIECSFDLSTCTRWDPHIYHPDTLDRRVLQENSERLEQQRRGAIDRARVGEIESITDFFTRMTSPFPADAIHRAPTFRNPYDIRHMAESLCGRGVGLTPAGDDVLAGWMAVGWLLYGPEPDFLEACQQIIEVARRQTHLLSRCWLAFAARGDVALPIVALLEALAQSRTSEEDTRLEQAAQVVLAMGATSGSDVITGILLGLQTYLASCTEEE